MMYNYTMLLTNKGMGFEGSFIPELPIDAVIRVMCKDCMEILYDADGITECILEGIISNTDTKVSYEFKRKAEIEVEILVDESEPVKEIDYKTAEWLMS